MRYRTSSYSIDIDPALYSEMTLKIILQPLWRMQYTKGSRRLTIMVSLIFLEDRRMAALCLK